MKTLFKGAAGTWPNLTGNANLVPVVAKGQVLVASHNQLEIFGFTAAVTTTTLASSPNPSPYGGRVSITATVHSTTTGTPTGTVTFQEGATTLGTALSDLGRACPTLDGSVIRGDRVHAAYRLCLNGERFVSPTCQLDVLDRIGGGDGFASGLSYGLISGRSPEEALRLGWAHGALLTTYHGDVTQATRQEVEALAQGGSARVQR